MAFPKWLFITQEKENDGSKWLATHEDQIEAVESGDSDTTTVASYQLVKVNKLTVDKTIRHITKGKKVGG